MGLTHRSTGLGAVDRRLIIEKLTPEDKVVALAGNPNVGKSTVFNGLTGLKQHTGNWPGKTVTNTQGRYEHNGKKFILVDIPGTYSLMACSAEEEIARDFICFGRPDVTVVVADATCLERNLNLILQILEITPRVVVCVNLLDEAKKKKIQVDLSLLSSQLGVPVVGTSARAMAGLDSLMDQVSTVAFGEVSPTGHKLIYDGVLEQAIGRLVPTVQEAVDKRINARWVALKLLDADNTLKSTLSDFLGSDITQDEAVVSALNEAQDLLVQSGIDEEELRDLIVAQIVRRAEAIFRSCVHFESSTYNKRDRKIDRILTSKATGIPVMILMMGIIFWITLTGANYPSNILSSLFVWMEGHLNILCVNLGMPLWLHGLLVSGVFRTVGWIVAVMLPPMAIFFPLFTLLEDSGYLPRIAFNMDKFFRKANAHGKQSLTMCMGFGCNACGVIGCRIIDSPRERLIAILTNNFVPCNGRFPTLISIITMFFAAFAGPAQSVVSTLLLMGIILLGIFMTLIVSRLLSKTLLRGIPSSFALELPPYRRPQIGKVIVRSVFDRTLFVLGRAVAVAAPAGVIIWLMSNLTIGDTSILRHCCAFLDPFARLFGLDGVILMAFILGFPANEIVIPIVIMSYLCTGSMVEISNLDALRQLLVQNGWTWVTAVCTMLFSLMHFPCATTCWTIKKETQSVKWTALSFLIPTAVGLLACFLVNTSANLLGLV